MNYNTKLKEYLRKFNTDLRLNIIGPMFEGQVVDLSEPVIFVDGGTAYKDKYDVNLGFSAGDNDSYSGQLDLKINKIKDFSDLAFCLNAINNDFKCINLIGFLGGRKDHEIMNVFEVHNFLKSKINTWASLENEISLFSSGEYEFSINGTFSVVLLEKAEVKLWGECEYKINSDLDNISSKGLSNEGHGKINLTTNSPIIIYGNIEHDLL